MALHHSPRVVTDGLVLCLDAASKESYPGSGTVWRDLAGSNNGALVNVVGYSSANGGSLTFDGVDDYATLLSGFISTLTTCTFDFWFFWTTAADWSRVFDFGTGTAVNMFFTPKSGSTTPRFAITTGGGGGEQQITSPTLLTTNTWHNFTITLNGTTGTMYRNTNILAINNSMTLNPSSLGITTQNYIGRSQYADPYFSGNISNFKIYNRALTPTEILQNYNATKSRYNL